MPNSLFNFKWGTIIPENIITIVYFVVDFSCHKFEFLKIMEINTVSDKTSAEIYK